MFWNRKPKGGYVRPDIIIPQYCIPDPPKKEFETMLQVLRDAEKYDKVGDVEVRNYLLTALECQIERVKTEKL